MAPPRTSRISFRPGNLNNVQWYFLMVRLGISSRLRAPIDDHTLIVAWSSAWNKKGLQRLSEKQEKTNMSRYEPIVAHKPVSWRGILPAATMFNKCDQLGVSTIGDNRSDWSWSTILVLSGCTVFVRHYQYPQMWLGRCALLLYIVSCQLYLIFNIQLR